MSVHLNAATAGPAAPDAAISDKARGANAGQVRDQSAADTPDATGLLGSEQRKVFAGLQASAALRGFVVNAIESDDGSCEYCVTRWAHTRRCRSLGELASALRSMGVRP